MRSPRRKATDHARWIGYRNETGASGRPPATIAEARAALAAARGRGLDAARGPADAPGGGPVALVGAGANRRGNCPNRHASEGWHPSGVGEMEADVA